ncbi:MAG TPA: NAD(P)-binding domain-containing protein [candidate division Zixibacteria bacterium]|nr:NAD(P)-binding domain-containing protein [candidate division Zixibacteria bacterium]
MSKKRVAVIGSGPVGETLANGFLAHGYHVMRASRSPEKLADWLDRAGERAHTGNPAAASAWANTVVLAVKGGAAESTLQLCGIENLAGKTVIDTTNPIAEAPPENGVLRFFTTLDESLMERLQRAAPEAHFVKAFSCVGHAHMVEPEFAGEKPTMFICGNDPDAKASVVSALEKFGWETADMGGVESARAIEPLCMLWCIPGFRENSWNHAFKLLRK